MQYEHVEHIFDTNLVETKKIETKNKKYLQQQNVLLETSNGPKRQLLKINSATSNAIKSLGISLAWWAHNPLRSISDKIVQA